MFLDHRSTKGYRTSNDPTIIPKEIFKLSSKNTREITKAAMLIATLTA
jgi:hypothetical protein